MTESVIAAPPAQNLTILKEDTILFKRSFAYNPRGNYYIINQFDLTTLTLNPSIEFLVNGYKNTEYLLYLFKNFSIVNFKDYYFFFVSETCDIKEFTKLDRHAGSIVNSLLILVLNKQTHKKKLIYQQFSKSQKTLKYGRGRFSSEIPFGLLKDKTYKIVFEYRNSGNDRPIVMLAKDPFCHEDIPVQYVLDISIKNRFRKISILFHTKTILESPRLHLLIRGKRGFKGEVTFKNLFVYQYEKNLRDAYGFTGSQIAYLGYIKLLEKAFIGLKIVSSSNNH